MTKVARNKYSMPVVRVCWVDSVGGVGWEREPDLEGAAPVHSIGWLYRETPDFVQLTSHETEDGSHHADLLIPKCAIFEMEVLRGGEACWEKRERVTPTDSL